MSAACIACARICTEACKECNPETAQPGELPRNYVPLTLHAVAVRIVAEQKQEDAKCANTNT